MPQTTLRSHRCFPVQRVRPAWSASGSARRWRRRRRRSGGTAQPPTRPRARRSRRPRRQVGLADVAVAERGPAEHVARPGPARGCTQPPVRPAAGLGRLEALMVSNARSTSRSARSPVGCRCTRRGDHTAFPRHHARARGQGIRSTIVRLGLMDARGRAGDPARYVLLDLPTHGCSVFSRLGPGRLFAGCWRTRVPTRLPPASRCRLCRGEGAGPADRVIARVDDRRASRAVDPCCAERTPAPASRAERLALDPHILTAT